MIMKLFVYKKVFPDSCTLNFWKHKQTILIYISRATNMHTGLCDYYQRTALVNRYEIEE